MSIYYQIRICVFQFQAYNMIYCFSLFYLRVHVSVIAAKQITAPRRTARNSPAKVNKNKRDRVRSCALSNKYIFIQSWFYEGNRTIAEPINSGRNYNRPAIYDCVRPDFLLRTNTMICPFMAIISAIEWMHTLRLMVRSRGFSNVARCFLQINFQLRSIKFILGSNWIIHGGVDLKAHIKVLVSNPTN